MELFSKLTLHNSLQSEKMNVLYSLNVAIRSGLAQCSRSLFSSISSSISARKRSGDSALSDWGEQERRVLDITLLSFSQREEGAQEVGGEVRLGECEDVGVRVDKDLEVMGENRFRLLWDGNRLLWDRNEFGCLEGEVE